MKFTKMQGLGNDYVYLDCTRAVPDDLATLAVKLSDRHFGVGADGLICICPSERADFRMRMFNADGSEGEMCGNGIRCVGKYVYDKGLIGREDITIETLSGVKSLHITQENGCATAVMVDMGIPVVEPLKILDISGEKYVVHPVSMGNPHAVIFDMSVKRIDLTDIGSQIECHSAFPGRTNVEFIEVTDPSHLKMRVWERGSGETLACGTGACAAVAAAVLTGRTKREVTVTLPGGDLLIRWDESDGHIYMTGPAVTVFEGEWSNTKERGVSNGAHQ